MAKTVNWKWCAVTPDEMAALFEQLYMLAKGRLAETMGVRGLTVDGIFFYIPTRNAKI